MFIRVIQTELTVVFFFIFNRAIQNYEKRYSNDGGFEITAFLGAIGDFIGIFSLSLLVGAFIGCLTALISFSISVLFLFISYYHTIHYITFLLLAYNINVV